MITVTAEVSLCLCQRLRALSYVLQGSRGAPGLRGDLGDFGVGVSTGFNQLKLSERGMYRLSVGENGFSWESWVHGTDWICGIYYTRCGCEFL